MRAVRVALLVIFISIGKRTGSSAGFCQKPIDFFRVEAGRFGAVEFLRRNEQTFPRILCRIGCDFSSDESHGKTRDTPTHNEHQRFCTVERRLIHGGVMRWLTLQVSHSARERRAACNEVNERPKATKLQAWGPVRHRCCSPSSLAPFKHRHQDEDRERDDHDDNARLVSRCSVCPLLNLVTTCEQANPD